MGWFLRKSIRLGPLRLTVSKGGVGASVGVKGLRAGVDSSGKPYVAGGRGGIYFRERMRTEQTTPTQPELPPRSGSGAVPWIVAALLALIVLLLLAGRQTT
jgi:hypothetical protein